MKRILFVICLCLSMTALAQQGEFNRFVIFGDSLSDTGNMYKWSMHVIPKSPPYYHGHFANGKIWIEHLAEMYFGENAADRTHNYAFGGAGAVISKKENLPVTLWHEVNDYLYLHHDSHKNTTLYFVWMGANNYLNAPTDVEEITTKVVQGISKEVEKLINHGAVMIVLANLPDLGVTPEAHREGHVALLHALTDRHNHKLDTRVQELRQLYPNVHFVYLDAENVFEKIEENPLAYGVKNETTPCYDGGYFIHGKPSPSDDTLRAYLKKQALLEERSLSDEQIEFILQNKALRIAVQNGYAASLTNMSSVDTVCEGDMFWDTAHPTSMIHKLMAEFMKKAIDDSGLKAI